MNILIDIGHPGHVHLYRNMISELQRKGHSIHVITKDIEAATILLKSYNIRYTLIGRKRDNLALKYVYQLAYIYRTLKIVIREKIDLGIGVSMTLPIISKFTTMKSIGMDDDDMSVTPVFAKFVNKSDIILTPDCLSHEKRGKNHICYPSYHELAYLHPNQFQPDPGVLSKANLKPGDKYFVLRFNSFKAHHDKAAYGLSNDQKLVLIRSLINYGKVFITSENELEPEFENYKLPVDPQQIHSLLFYATMFIGDSQTMTSEAAVVGTPAFKCNSFTDRLSVPNELEYKYKLCFSYLPEEFDKMLICIKKHLDMIDLKHIYSERRDLMLREKSDLTEYLIKFIEDSR